MSFIQTQMYTSKERGLTMNKIKVGLLGLGTVGSGVVRIIENHQDKLFHRVGCVIEVKKVLVRDFEKERLIDIPRDILTTNVDEILNDPEISVVIEVMGGIDGTKEYLIRALENHKHIVTANKDLMALHGGELLKIAKQNKCDLYYEASVAGGIPIIRSLVEGLSSDRINRIMGIVNGTTNYILTKMAKEGRQYDEVLEEAQKLGYAESDPTSDVEGLDAARKMTILATLGFSMPVELSDVLVKGISKVSKQDLDYAKQLGYTMKLIGLADRNEDGIEVSVEPTLLPEAHPLANVNDVFNAVYVYGEAVGETMFYGPGAGSLPTATAVVSDLVAVVKNLLMGVNGESVVSPQYEKDLKSSNEIYHKYFLRIHVKDEAGAFFKLISLFSNRNISIEKILQWPIKGQAAAEIVLVTHVASSLSYEDVMNDLGKLDVVTAVKSSYRVVREEK